jgi:alkylhydroperoxidase family enzyme
MTRIPLSPSTTDELRELFAAATNGRQPPLNLHRQMASGPAVLAAYVGVRRAIEAHGTLDQRTRFALMLAVSAADGCEYTQAINTVLTTRAGMARDDVRAVLAGEATGQPRLDALLSVARAAARHDGRVDGVAWRAARDAGVTDTELAEAYASIALAVFVDHFVNYAETPFDVPMAGRQAA